MNVAQELGDNDLYNYDVLVKLLSDRFDPASRVLAFRSRFHGRLRRHHEDADAFADALAALCRVGYPQSPPELRQELITEQFVRGQSDPELKKYLWVVIRTQKDKKLQTLIEVCTDLSNLVTPTHLHRPAEQTFAVHQQAESHTEEDEDLENVFAVGDCPSWNNRRSPDPTASPSIQQMFALARSPDSRMPNADLRGVALSLIRIADSVLKHVPAGTTRGSNASFAESLVTCRPAAQDRTLPFPSNRRVGIYNLITGHSATGTIIRETLRRPGPHPHWSIHTSFDPLVIFMHHIDLIRSITG